MSYVMTKKEQKQALLLLESGTGGTLVSDCLLWLEDLTVGELGILCRFFECNVGVLAGKVKAFNVWNRKK